MGTVVRTMKELGAFIRTARKSKGLRQYDLTGVMNAGNRLLGDIERGKETAHVGRVLNVLALLGYDIVLVKKGETLE